jgi:hypothetical protein
VARIEGTIASDQNCPPEGRGKAVVDCNARISCHCHAAVRAKPAGGHGHASPSWYRQCGGRVKARVGASPLAWPRFGGAPTAAVTVTSAERFATKRGVRKGALQDGAPGRGRPAQPNDAAGRRAIFLRRITIVPRLAPRFLAKGAIPKSGFADALVCASLRWVSPAASAQNGSPAPSPAMGRCPMEQGACEICHRVELCVGQLLREVEKAKGARGNPGMRGH